MMISPESFYEDMKKKSVKGIEKEIKRLRNTIDRLKRKIEHPIENLTDLKFTCPSDDTVLYWSRFYLEKAIQALEEKGGKYEPTSEEQRIIEFNENLPYINKITFKIREERGPDLNSFEAKVFNDKFEIDKHIMSTRIFKNEKFHIDKEYVLREMKNLYIGDWLDEYTPERFGYITLDGISWNLEIHFSNDHEPKIVHGSNDYPYNFRDFLELFECLDLYDRDLCDI